MHVLMFVIDLVIDSRIFKSARSRSFSLFRFPFTIALYSLNHILCIQSDVFSFSGCLYFVIIGNALCSFWTHLTLSTAVDGNATYITIYAVFVTKASGETLLRSAEDGRTSCYLIPSANFCHWSTWSIAAVVVTSICVVLLALSIFLCVRHHQLKRRQRALESQPLLGWWYRGIILTTKG